MMGACSERDINLSFCTPNGRFLARTTGIVNGNVLLRRKQYRAADEDENCSKIAVGMVFGKIYNARWSIEQTKRDHTQRIDENKFAAASEMLRGLLSDVISAKNTDTLRGYEGVAAAAYFGVFDDMILRDKENFYYHGRNRRPPLDLSLIHI